MKVATGDNVKVHYRGTLPDGTEFDNSHTRGEPLGVYNWFWSNDCGL